MFGDFEQITKQLSAAMGTLFPNANTEAFCLENNLQPHVGRVRAVMHRFFQKADVV